MLKRISSPIRLMSISWIVRTVDFSFLHFRRMPQNHAFPTDTVLPAAWLPHPLADYRATYTSVQTHSDNPHSRCGTHMSFSPHSDGYEIVRTLSAPLSRQYLPADTVQKSVSVPHRVPPVSYPHSRHPEGGNLHLSMRMHTGIGAPEPVNPSMDTSITCLT